MSDPDRYENWTKEALIERIKQLEARGNHAKNFVSEADLSSPTGLKNDATTTVLSVAPGSEAPNSLEKKKNRLGQAMSKRKIDISKWSTRYIALKLAYLGKRYGGFEHQASSELPTIESELWKALTISRLITPEDTTVVDFSCCDYSKCGRTDRGVSSFGQVIGLRVRSKRPQATAKKPRLEGEVAEQSADDDGVSVEADVRGGDASEQQQQVPAWDHIRDEFEYCKMLNRLLPEDIRILAWCPSPRPEFSARFSCRERQYRYFFTQPAFSPLPSACAVAGGQGAPREGWLDISAMQKAAKLFEGEHDFRNVCKIDPSKQITNYRRRIYDSYIEEVTDARPILPYLDGAAFSATVSEDSDKSSWPKVYSFNVNGTAFLWHQIRHMVAILFMVGQGLENPSIVSTLLDVEKTPRRPMYAMSDEVPLVLWDCIFPELDEQGNGVNRADVMDWIYVGDDDLRAKYGVKGVMDVLWEGWRSKMMDELLSSRLMGVVAAQGKDVRTRLLVEQGGDDDKKKLGGKPRLYSGGNTWLSSGAYVPLLKRQLQMSPAEQNEKYAVKMGYGSSAEMKAAKGYR